MVDHLQPLTKQCGRAQRGFEEKQWSATTSGVRNPSLVRRGHRLCNGVKSLSSYFKYEDPF